MRKGIRLILPITATTIVLTIWTRKLLVSVSQCHFDFIHTLVLYFVNLKFNVQTNNGVPGVGQPVAGVAGMVRRDENSISFRHFLQPHSDVVPAPAPTCRRSRGRIIIKYFLNRIPCQR